MHECIKCRVQFTVEEEHEFPQIKLCYHCFEDAVEEADIRRRKRIARQNEY